MDSSDFKTEILVRLDRIDANLGEHMRRSALLEQRQDSLESSIKPITTHVNMMAGAFKLLLVVGAAVALLKALGFLN
jgi:hypothetical protein